MMSLDQLDYLCATEIMGWEPDANSPFGLFFNYVGIAWRPTIEIDQAWRLLNEIGLPFDLVYHPEQTPGKYYCCITKDGETWFNEFADIPGVAIVKTCLLCKGVAFE